MYTGSLGVALAAHSVGDACADTAITEAARAIALSVIANPPGEDTLLDYLVGAAGGIVALLRLADMTGEEAFLESAVAASALICRHAQRTQGTAAWNNRRAGGFDSGGRPLTGLAHGAAGMGIALLEVAARTQRSDFYDIGAEAFAYEDSLLDRALGNWPDLRGSTPSFGVAWCHGAAGIGLSRLRALRLFGASTPDSWVGAAEIALRTTRRTIERCDASIDATPCHGLAGLLEVLVSASQVFGDSQLLALARASWRRVAEERAGRQWSCGTPSRRPTPGLMLGLSGVGWTCLRLHDPSITESVLI
jgi:lantibiotic modifying enzyme